jgi:streptogramin lyase
MVRRVWQGLLVALLVALGVLTAVPIAAQATAISEFPPGGLGSGHDPLGLESGADGNLWFTDGGSGHAIGRITTAGAIQEFTAGLTSPANPFDITQGPDGNMWFTASGDAPHNAIGMVTPSGAIKEFGPPTTEPNMAPAEITAGPDGNLWFLDVTTPAIGRITPAGVITEFKSGLLSGAMPETLTAGADGNMWFTDKAKGAIGRVTPAGKIKEFHTGKAGSMPTESTLGADGNVWFSDPGVPAVGRVTPDGTITEFKKGLNANADPDPMTLGPDGNVWFIDQNAAHRAVGRITPSGAIAEFSKGLSQNNPQDDITVGADGNIWVEQASQDGVAAGGVARITPAGVINEFASGLNTNPGQGADGDVLLSGPDGNLWFSDRGSLAIGKISLQIPPTATTGTADAVTDTTATVAGVVNPLGSPTAITFQYGTTSALGSTAAAGTLPAAGDPSNVTASLTGLTPGTVIFYRVAADNGFGGTVTGAVQSFVTAASPPPPPSLSPPAPLSPPSPSPSPPPPPARLMTATVGNQQIQLVTPSLLVCTARAKTLAVMLRSVAIPHSRAAKLRFANAVFFIDKGVRHTRKRTTRLRNGHKRTKVVVVFTANAVARHLPSTPVLRLAGLRSGLHTLRVTVSYKKTVSGHRHHRTVVVTKTLRAKLNIC